jgi:heme-degrading monooxygenase HmoA
MYARVTTLHVQPGKLTELTAFMREAGSPALQQQPGFQGLLVLTAPESDQAMTIALWDNLADIEVSAAASYAPEVTARLGSFVAGPPIRADYEVMIQEGERQGEGTG